MEIGVRSDVGKVREINEDAVFLSDAYPNGLRIAIVADGMGGHLAGEVASQTAIDTIMEQLHHKLSENNSIESLENALKLGIMESNSKIFQQSKEDIQYRGMGTTVVTAIIDSDWIILGHIGDSRAYLVNPTKIVQLTKDHSLVNELLRNGQITEEEAENHPQKNILTRALGTDEIVKIDHSVIHWEKDDTLILCSDGLTNRVNDQMILDYVNNDDFSAQEVADQLVNLANQAGGEDNISVIIIRHD